MKELQFLKYIFCSALIVYELILCFFPSFVDFRTITLIEGSYILWCLAFLAGCIVINNVIKFLFDYIDGILKPFRYVGENAMTFYCLHWIILNVAEYFCRKIGILSNIHIFITLLLSCVLLLSLFNKLIKNTSLKTAIGIQE